MATATRKTELSPLEAILVEMQLGNEARMPSREGTLARIQQLTKERQRLYAKSAAHPILAPANGARIRQLSAEIDRLWGLLRRERATRRVQIERTLNVTVEDDDADARDSAPAEVVRGTSDAA